MGRELKRVPIDFKWPQGQIWKGYLNPFHSQECKACDGECYNTETRKLADAWYSFGKERWINLPNGKRYNDLAWSNHLAEIEIEALVKGGRLSDLMPFWYRFDEETNEWVVLKTRPGEWEKCEKPEMPTPEIVNEWNKTRMGHDAINRSICIRTRAQHLGIFGRCEFCDGEGVIWQSEEIKKLNEDWESFEPPTGDGFQLWETTSEGSPSSPVFETLGLLCEWCEDNATTFGSSKTTKEGWFKMFSDDFVFHQEGNAIFI